MVGMQEETYVRAGGGIGRDSDCRGVVGVVRGGISDKKQTSLDVDHLPLRRLLHNRPPVFDIASLAPAKQNRGPTARRQIA